MSVPSAVMAPGGRRRILHHFTPPAPADPHTPTTPTPVARGLVGIARAVGASRTSKSACGPTVGARDPSAPACAACPAAAKCERWRQQRKGERRMCTEGDGDRRAKPQRYSINLVPLPRTARAGAEHAASTNTARAGGGTGGCGRGRWHGPQNLSHARQPSAPARARQQRHAPGLGTPWGGGQASRAPARRPLAVRTKSDASKAHTRTHTCKHARPPETRRARVLKRPECDHTARRKPRLPARSPRGVPRT